MKIRAYSPRTATDSSVIIAEDITGINFGLVRQGQHGSLPVLIRPVEEAGENISGLEFYLQNNGGFSNSEFGVLTSSTYINNVISYVVGSTGAVISDHLSVVSDPPSVTGGVPINLNANREGDFVWLDVQAGSAETGRTTAVNYRFTFEYS